MTRSKATKPAAAPRKLREPSIEWAQQDTDLIVEWFCTRSEDGIPANYEAYVTTVHTDVPKRLLQGTRLILLSMLCRSARSLEAFSPLHLCMQ